MIATLTGTVIARDAGRIVLDVGGVGYEIFISLTTFYRMPTLGSATMIHTRQLVRDEQALLYGFADAAEKHAFDLLIKVPHVGPKHALSILSVMSSADLAAAIAREDVHRLDAVPGVGTKLAERVVRELRDKVGELRTAGAHAGNGRVADTDAAAAGGGPLDDAVSALINLGIKPAEARRAVDSVLADESSSADDLEATIRKSLAIILSEK
ncbi:MAG: Holliday junction branch migration protein RuvA [Candidatus Binataceae bacterium]